MATQTKPSAENTTPFRAYKNITISLGAFTTFPAKLVAAAREEGTGLRLAVIENGEAKPVSQFYTADNTNYFPIGQLGRAVEVGENLVPVTEAERAGLKVAGSKMIDITKFVDLYTVDPVFFDKSYVIVPDVDPKKGNPNAANLYHLMLQVMVAKKLVGMAKMTDRDKEYNVIIRPSFDGTTLMLHTIFTSNEVRRIPIPAATLEFNPAHIAMGYSLIDSLAGTFDPNNITSESDNLMAALVARKTAIANGTITAEVVDTPKESSTASAADSLTAALTASLYAAGVKPPVETPVTTETPAPKKSRRIKTTV